MPPPCLKWYFLILCRPHNQLCWAEAFCANIKSQYEGLGHQIWSNKKSVRRNERMVNEREQFSVLPPTENTTKRRSKERIHICTLPAFILCRRIYVAQGWSILSLSATFLSIYLISAFVLRPKRFSDTLNCVRSFQWIVCWDQVRIFIS